jgi:uncharacterized protein (DUF1330 family)
MKYYAVAELDVADPSWVNDYISNVTAMIERRGGRYLSRTAQIEHIEGERTPPAGFLLIEWPSRDLAMEFYDSEEYRPYRDRRQAGARNQFYLIAGEDLSGEAQIQG